MDAIQAAQPIAQSHKKPNLFRVAVATVIGTAVEAFDFLAYGTAAALVFNKIFFPQFDPVTGTLAAFGAFASGMLARPIGGILFGHFGDRIGRKSMLTLSLLLMGICTVLIGLLPTYEQIGISAAVLLVVLRIGQGLSFGGEMGGAMLMAVEHAPPKWKAFFGSLPLVGAPLGILLSVGSFALVTRLPEADFLSWGWRLPFLASVVLLLVGWFIRVKVAESPDFEQMKEKGAKVEVPVAEVLKHHRRALLVVVGARLAEVTWFYTVVTFSLAYATGTLGIARSVMLDATIWGAAVALFTMPLFGMLGDKIGHKWVFMVGTLGILACAPVFFHLLGTRDTGWIILAVCLAVGLVYACLYGPEGTLFSSQFPAEVRYTGISLAVQVSGAIGGGLAPIVATWLLAKGGGDPQYVVWYLSILGVIALFSAWLMRSEAPAVAALRVPARANLRTP